MVGGRRRGSTDQSILFHPHTGSRESEWEVWSGNKSSESVPSDVPSVTRLYLLKFPQPLKHMSPWKTFPIQINSLSLMNWVHQFLYNTECWKSHFFIHSLSRAKEWFVIITRNKTRMKKNAKLHSLGKVEKYPTVDYKNSTYLSEGSMKKYEMQEEWIGSHGSTCQGWNSMSQKEEKWLILQRRKSKDEAKKMDQMCEATHAHSMYALRFAVTHIRHSLMAF